MVGMADKGDDTVRANMLRDGTKCGVEMRFFLCWREDVSRTSYHPL